VFLCFVCLCPVSCVPNVVSVSGLSILDCFLTIKNGQHRDTDNIRQTRHRTKTNKTQKHNTTQKTIKNGQPRDTDNIRQTRHICLRPVSCLPNVVSVSGLSILDCFLCCVVFLCFVCLRPVSCLPNVVSVSGLSILDCFLCCVVFLCFVCL
jgi:hypothetical protein